jgi:uncharacterized membrane protein YfcA
MTSICRAHSSATFILATRSDFLGAHFRRNVNERTMRWTVVGIGLVTAGYFFIENYVHHL